LSIAPTNADQSEGDAGTTAFTFTVTRTGDLSGASSASFAVAGSGGNPADGDDFGGVLPSGMVNFAAGEDTQVLTVLVSGDTAFEADEGFTVSLSGALGATIDPSNDTADGVIENDDVQIISSIFLGDAPMFPSFFNRRQWVELWSDDEVTTTHVADFTDAAEDFSPVILTSVGGRFLEDGDIFFGDLGVSGVSNGGAFNQSNREIDGTEALRFELVEEAVELTFGVNLFNAEEPDTGFTEAGRVLLLDADGNVVAEEYFFADNADGLQVVTVSASEGYTQAIFNAGAFDGGEFIFGAYANADGSFATEQFEQEGVLEGSNYVLDFVEFSFGMV
ncbi:MAG: hypothetical protein AAF495_12280, partial [Pseudomonadota bacterium]